MMYGVLSILVTSLVRSVTPIGFTAFEALIGEATTTAPLGINMTYDVLAVGEGNAATDPVWCSSPSSLSETVLHFSSYDAVLVPTVRYLPPEIIKALRKALDGGAKVVILGGEFKDAAYVTLETLRNSDGTATLPAPQFWLLHNTTAPYLSCTKI